MKTKAINVLTACVEFRACCWRLIYTAADDNGKPIEHINIRLLQVRGRLNGVFARREAAMLLGCPEKTIGLEAQ